MNVSPNSAYYMGEEVCNRFADIDTAKVDR